MPGAKRKVKPKKDIKSKKKTSTSLQNQKMSKLKISGIAAGVSGVAATIGAITKLSIENKKLKKQVSSLQEEVGYYRKMDIDKGSSIFNLFGRKSSKSGDESTIKKLDADLLKCNKAFIDLLKQKEECDKAYLNLLNQKPSNPIQASPEKRKSQGSVADFFSAEGSRTSVTDFINKNEITRRRSN